MQKHRIKRVAAIHMIVSMVAGLWLVLTIERFIRDQWLSFSIYHFLQPLSLLLDFAPQPSDTIDNIPMKILSWFIIICGAISTLLWSICFGWLYVKFTNWLNHFPVLGRKVF